MGVAIVWLVNAVLSFYWWLVIASAIFSWLYAFNVINSNNQFVGMIGKFLYDITEPALRPIRRVLPAFGSVDLSPIVLLLGIGFLQVLFNSSVAPILLG
jgi:YggT family protein